MLLSILASGSPHEKKQGGADGMWGYGDGNGGFNLDGNFAKSGYVVHIISNFNCTNLS